MQKILMVHLASLGFKDLGVSARPGLVVLRRTRMPAVLIETGFINNDSDNALFDEKFDDIAEAIAYAILGTLDETKTEEPNILPLFYIEFRPDNSVKKQMLIISFMNYRIWAIPLLSLKRMDFIKYRLGHFIN